MASSGYWPEHFPNRTDSYNDTTHHFGDRFLGLNDAQKRWIHPWKFFDQSSCSFKQFPFGLKYPTEHLVHRAAPFEHRKKGLEDSPGQSEHRKK
ncbi:hypothetical protein [uncultured Sunxiuqinia sp.]|uniref:hypothetical protein n=1 Tax=uncultured Sunxiuqinia sp. TaxID=1573825 RepID=UPI0026264C53|nr:hypothetical protein [uncultured Sunxiuqinia sp.]